MVAEKLENPDLGRKPSAVMMRRRAMTAGGVAAAGVATALVAGYPAGALAAIVGYVLVGGGRAGWLRPQWYEPVVSGSLACVTATLCRDPWWQVGFLAVAVIEALRAVRLVWAGGAEL